MTVIVSINAKLFVCLINGFSSNVLWENKESSDNTLCLFFKFSPFYFLVNIFSRYFVSVICYSYCKANIKWLNCLLITHHIFKEIYSNG